MSKSHEPKGPRRTDFQQALKSMDTLIDITVDDLMALSQRAEQIASRRDTEAIGVARVMSQPVRTVHPQTSLTDAAHLMVSERISGLPVVDDAGLLVGIITEADFLSALGVPAHQPHHTLWQTLESLVSHQYLALEFCIGCLQFPFKFLNPGTQLFNLLKFTSLAVQLVLVLFGKFFSLNSPGTEFLYSGLDSLFHV